MTTLCTPYNNRAEWLAMRRKGIGSTDASVITGHNRYSTPYQLWLEKTQGVERPDDEIMRLGREFEDVVAKMYAEDNGVTVDGVNLFFRHPRHEYVCASIDRIVHGDSRGDGLLECKTTVSQVHRTWNGSLPIVYFIQAQYQMMVTGFQWCDVAVLVLDTRKTHTYTVTADVTVQGHILEAVTKWWGRHIVDGHEPTPTVEDVATMPTSEETAEADKTTQAAIALYLDARAREKEWKTRKEEAGAVIKAAFGTASTLTISTETVATWKAQNKVTIDAKALKKTHPEIFAEFSEATTSRTLRVIGDDNA